MSITLYPRHTLGFPGPLTRLVTQTLTITNHNNLPVTYKVKTTAADVFCVRPNPGRVEPGETVQVAVMHEPMTTEPPMTAKCTHKFLVLSTLIHDDADGDKSLQEIWNAVDAGGKEVHRYKMRVRYLPAVRYQTLHEDEGESHIQAEPSDSMSPPIVAGVLEGDDVQEHSEFFVAHEEPQSRPSSVRELDLDTQSRVSFDNVSGAEIEHLKGLLAGLTFPDDETPSKPKAYRRWHSVRVAVPKTVAITVAVFIMTYLFL
ncbi:PapD-like protein [Hymenopellis radicata]|nr:PapD-like protein [Hymenopellis radicata]